MNALEKVIDLLTAICLMFLIPLLYYGSGRQVSCAMLTGQAGEIFLNRISTAGEITLPVWTDFETSMTRFGCNDFELLRERSLFEKDDGTGAIVEKVYTESLSDLLIKVEQEGRYRLQKGDKIKLILYVNGIPTVLYEVVRTGATNE